METKECIVVTGAFGFIGSCVVKELNNRGFYNICLVDNVNRKDKWKNVLGKRFTHIFGKEELHPWLESLSHKGSQRVSGIIHLGACSDTLEQDGDYLLDNNFRYTKRLATYAKERGVRFIYASSAATYGDGHLGFSDAPDRLHALSPLNLYGFSKHIFDIWALEQGLLTDIVGLKYFNVFGPNENHKGHMASMVYKMFHKAKDEGVIELFASTDPGRFADGEQCRDFIYVKDVAKMTVDFLFNDIAGIFNMGRGETATWNRLAEALFSALGKKPNIRYVAMPKDLARQYQNFTCADMERYRVACDYPLNLPFRYTLEEAVSEYVREYLLKGQRW